MFIILLINVLTGIYLCGLDLGRSEGTYERFYSLGSSRSLGKDRRRMTLQGVRDTHLRGNDVAYYWVETN